MDEMCGASNTCQAVVCVFGARSCGGSCSSCPPFHVKTTKCSGTACIAATCDDGSLLSGGDCIWQDCGAGRFFCSTACAACPTKSAQTFGCNGSSCVAKTCAAGFHVWEGRCIDSDWSYELIDPNARTSMYSAAIAVDSSGIVHVAYPRLSGAVVARRSAAGWTTTSVPFAPLRVTDLAIDSNGFAHVVYYKDFGSSTYHRYSYAYVRIDPTGSTSYDSQLDPDVDQVALTVDGSNQPHLAFNAGYHVYYWRPYAGLWIPRIIATTSYWASPSIAVDTQGAVHIAGISAGNVMYTKMVNSIISPAISVTGPAGTSKTLLYIGGATPEIWAQSEGSWYVSTVSATAISAPTAWYTQTTNPTIAAARGPTGFATLELLNGVATARRGPTSGPTLTEVTNLSLGYLETTAVMDRNGTFHALYLTNMAPSSPFSSPLNYVRGH